LPKKIRARTPPEIGCTVILVPAVERGVNEHEIGRIVRFGRDHPAVKGINFQPAFHAGRHGTHDPMQRMTNPDIIKLIAEQTEGMFVISDFIPVPCCFPTCNSVTYAYIHVSDLTRSAVLPAELQGLLAWIACIADARPVAEYAQYLQDAGFASINIEPHDEALSEMGRDIQGKLLGAELMSKLKKFDLEGIDFKQAKVLARAAGDAVRSGTLGYAIVTGKR